MLKSKETELESVNTVTHRIHATRPLPRWHCKLPQLLHHVSHILRARPLRSTETTALVFPKLSHPTTAELAQQRTHIHPEFLAKML